MSEPVNFKTIWHEAGIPSLVLASVSTAYFLASNALSNFQGIWTTGVNTVLDLAKIVACIWLMKIYISRFAQEYENATRRDLRRLGTMMALLSALIFSACTMAYYIWNPEDVQAIFDTIWEAMGERLDANSATVLEKMQEDFPRYTFFGNAIYCFIFGWILSSILSARILPDNPFARETFGEDNDENE